jgi:hypothetical protein
MQKPVLMGELETTVREIMDGPEQALTDSIISI